MLLRRVLLAALVLLGAAVPAYAAEPIGIPLSAFRVAPGTVIDLQTPPVATPGQAFGVDYPDAAFTAGGVTRFELLIDAGTWTDVGLPTKQNDPQTPAGSSTYRIPIPAVTPGTHTVSVRACNTVLCGSGTPLAFLFGVQPATVPAVRIIGGL